MREGSKSEKKQESKGTGARQSFFDNYLPRAKSLLLLLISMARVGDGSEVKTFKFLSLFLLHFDQREMCKKNSDTFWIMISIFLQCFMLKH